MKEHNTSPYLNHLVKANATIHCCKPLTLESKMVLLDRAEVEKT